MTDRLMDRQCRRCGYELTGLDIQGRCPECGNLYDGWSGQGLSGGPTEAVERGDRVVKLMQAIGLAAMALFVVGIGALFAWRSDRVAPLVFAGVFGMLFLIGAVSTAWTLLKKSRTG